MKIPVLKKEYSYVKKRLLESGIKFSDIPKNDMLKTCEQYNGIISSENYSAIVKAIEDIYDSINLYT